MLRSGEILLGRKFVDLDRGDNSGAKLLLHADRCGHERVVKMLLELGEVSRGEPNKNGIIPLSWAAWEVHEAIMKMLLSREKVNPDHPDNYGQT